MKNKLPSWNRHVLRGLLCSVIIVSFFTNSCRKDNKGEPETALPAGVAQAKSWYESVYPVIAESAKGRNFSKQSKNASADYSQFIKADWKHGNQYNRLNKDVIELPVDPAHQINSALRDIANNSLFAVKEYSRSSYLIMREGKDYQAYIMTIVADPAYLRGDTGKLAHNTYRRHDADFGGLVLYFTPPQGKYLAGYRYQNGQLVMPPKAGSAKNLSLNRHAATVFENAAPNCLDWYLDTYVDGELISAVYLYTICYGSSPGSGGGGGSDPGSPPPPDPCTGTPPNEAYNNKARVFVYQPQPAPNPGDGGFPPPPPANPTPPCAVGGGGTTPDFGEDDPNQCLNCRVADNNFDDLLNYAESAGLNIGDPYNATVTVGGITYTGQITQIYNAQG